MNNRMSDKKSCSGFYKLKFRNFGNCIYCGNPKQALDHVYPLGLAVNLEIWRPAVRAELRQGLNLVPSCNECNSLASNRPFTLIREKRKFIQKRLREKYLKKIQRVAWEDDEIKQLGRTLRTYVSHVQITKKVLELRIHYPTLERLSAMKDLR